MEKKSKGIQKKQLGYLTACFGVLAVSGVVWAATSGVLSVNGSEHVDLDFVSAACRPAAVTTGVPAGEGFAAGAPAMAGNLNCAVQLTAGANGANDVLNLGIYPREPGDVWSVTFYIKNVGAADATLGPISVNTQAGFGVSTGDIALAGNAFSIASTCVGVGETVGPYRIMAGWPAGDKAFTAGVTFEVTLNYTQAIAPCEP